MHPLEIKRSANPSAEILKTFKYLEKATLPTGTGGVICLAEKISAYSRENYIIPAWLI